MMSNEINSLITVVVPVYNVEKYLERCIKSIVGQTYPNLEILLVDDGSKDGCPEICDKWAQKDSRIKVIHKNNAGLGMARNTGIEHATGDYICFFDSDDYVDKSTIEKSYLRLINDKADVVLFGYTSISADGQKIGGRVANPPKITFEGEEIKDVFLPNLIAPDLDNGHDWNLQMSACMTVISMKLINRVNWRFVSERVNISEDVYSLLVLYNYVERVSVICEPLYFYVINTASLSRSFRSDRFTKIKGFYRECLELSEQFGYSEEIKNRLLQPFVSFSITALKQVTASALTFSEKMTLIKEIIYDQDIQEANRYLCAHKASFSRHIFYMVLRAKSTLGMYMLLKIRGR